MKTLCRSVLILALMAAWSHWGPSQAAVADGEARPQPFRAALLSVAQVTPPRLQKLRSAGFQGCVLELAEDAQAAAQRAAIDRIQKSGFDLYYWIEVARSPQLAQAHPRWMASLQGHSEWRRFFKTFPQPADGEVVKTYPWVPILYKEAFAAHFNRIESRLAKLPSPQGIFLNDLQGAPSACGCGNALCRWTADYGPIRTATPLEADAAGKFVAAVKELAPNCEVIPVWTTECEEHDGAQDGLCAGVGCFQGICWKAYTQQLMPVSRQAERLAVLLPYRDFERDLPIYGPEAGWVAHALNSFQQMPPRNQGDAIPANRLIAVLQGKNVTQKEIDAQIAQAERAGAAGYVVSYMRIAQDWKPQIVRYKQP